MTQQARGRRRRPVRASSRHDPGADPPYAPSPSPYRHRKDVPVPGRELEAAVTTIVLTSSAPRLRDDRELMADSLLACLLGLAGGLLYELVELAKFLRTYGHFPWSPRRKPRVVRVKGTLRRFETFQVYVIAVLIRGLVGAGVAAALTLAGDLNALSALITGTGSYSIIDRWAGSTAVHDGRPEPPSEPLERGSS